MIIALDFDRVIHDTDHPRPGRRMGPPMPGALDGVHRLVADGHTVFVHTVMANNEAGLQAVKDWLRWWDFPALQVNPKPAADLYVDDQAWEFWSWADFMQGGPHAVHHGV